MGPPSYNRFETAGRPPTLPTWPSIAVPDAAAALVVVQPDADGPAAEPVEVVDASGADACGADTSRGMVGRLLSYDLTVRRTRRHGSPTTRIPDLLVARFDARLVLGDGAPRPEGARDACARLRELVDRAPPPRPVAPLGAGVSSLDREAFEAGVRAIVALVEAGECYQVNLTRRLSWDAAVDGPALFSALAAGSPAPHSALLTMPERRAAITVVWRHPSGSCGEAALGGDAPIKGTARMLRGCASARGSRRER
jgi:hypothetical protein